MVIGNPNAGGGIETVWHLDRVDTPQAHPIVRTFAVICTSPAHFRLDVSQSSMCGRSANSCYTSLFCVFQPCEDDAVDDRCAQLAVIAGRFGERANSTLSAPSRSAL